MRKNTASLNKRLRAAAVSSQKPSEVQALLDKGADVNCRNEWGLTPVMLAAQYNTSAEVLRTLIAAGGDIFDQEPKYCSNALLLACNRNPKAAIVETLLQAGARHSDRNYLGETALIMAVSANPSTRVATALIKAGADINARDYQGHSVLDYAKLRGRTYLAALLKKLGAE